MILPEEFEAYTRQLMGVDLYATLKHGLAEEPPTSIRLNPFKVAYCHAIKKQIIESGRGESLSWCPEGLYLSERPNFTFDPLFHAGLYYVQEASSMFVSHVLRQLFGQPIVMLDLCAAPGGKSTAARTALPEGSLLFCNEPVKQRASILAENMQKFGHPDVVVTNNYPKEYAKSGLHFDVILADVPCSGEGMFRKDKTAMAEWSVKNVEKCSRLQRSIIEDVWPCLAENGYLIYSTCTFNAHENEENANWIANELGADFVEIETGKDWRITGSLIDDKPVYRFIPGRTKGEGLFVAVLRKRGESREGIDVSPVKGASPIPRHHRSNAKSQFGEPVKSSYARWLHGDFSFFQHHDNTYAISSKWFSACEQAAQSLHIVHAGVTLGVQKGKRLLPHTSLALSVAIKSGALSRVDVEYGEAVSFLRRETVRLPEGTPAGFVAVTYLGHPLGFVKNVGDRANNLYPQAWKIKTTYLPKQPADVLHLQDYQSSNHED